ncbi:MAG TPA: two-component regulator propeller domain-containing protein, partial [Ferruginibacter sp.]|nr:two-component regulator propeller domain-containing protein [Ferruginibacter sp.]
MHKVLLYLLLVCSLHTASAQYEEKDFVHYTVREGLSENYITCLMQDSWGYLWIGTDIGLNRFDGHAFKNFFQGTNTLPLLSGTISKLKLFGTHHMGIVSRGGLQLLNTRDLTLKNYVVADTTAFTIYRNAAWDAVELPGRAFAVTTASGFYVFDSSGKLNFRHDAYQLKDIGQKRILFGRDIFPLGNNEYISFINGDGFAYYNSAKKTFREISKEEKEWATLYPLPSKNMFGWISRYQLSHNEFILIQFGHNNMLYYNKGSNKTVVSPLELSPTQFT